MDFPLTPARRAELEAQYEKNLSRYPLARQEVEAFLEGKDEIFALCMRYLYGHMPAQDILSTEAEVLGSYVTASLEALTQIGYLRSVPEALFFPYVLHHRVNNENLDGSRGFLFRELLPIVKGKTMYDAALAVNYWCYAHATYTPADDRTLGPLGVLNRSYGRCGEESVLAVSALRSVGIPARQCYCPRWSHCDDNHAWVEVWIQGDWHYLGACEPEPVLDRGWFTAAASRAMRVDSKCWAGNALYEPVNCTSRYTESNTLTVGILENGQPACNARVAFQIVNYSELYTLWETETDESGCAQFETGPGDLLIFAQKGKKMALCKADLRKQTSLTLELGALPAHWAGDLVPPADTSGQVPYGDDPLHRKKLARCEAHLAARRNSFAPEGYENVAGLNAPEISAFLRESRYGSAEKETLLDTLRPKDFADITAETLTDALDTALPFRDRYPEDMFRNFVLSPRIADEMLLPERKKIRALFPRGFDHPRQILAWMRENLQILPDSSKISLSPSAYGCLRHRQVPAFAFDGVFVALCRAFGFPARMDIPTGMAEYWTDQGLWSSIQPQESPVELTLRFSGGKTLSYFEHITLGRWDGRDFVTLKYPDLTLESGHRFSLIPGFYRLTLTTRQIDGTASVDISHFSLREDLTMDVTPPADQTALRLKQVALKLPEGPVKDALSSHPGKAAILIFADPGSEPTEHLLTEMIDLAKPFQDLPCRILLVLEKPEDRQHPRVQRLLSAIGNTLLLPWDGEALAALHLQMQQGDLRLPFALCLDTQGRGIYADANYRIRMAQTLLDIQKLLPTFDSQFYTTSEEPS